MADLYNCHWVSTDFKLPRPFSTILGYFTKYSEEKDEVLWKVAKVKYIHGEPFFVDGDDLRGYLFEAWTSVDHLRDEG